MVIDPIRGKGIVDPMAAILGSRYVKWIEMKHPHVPAGLKFDKASIQEFMSTLPKQEVDAIVAKARQANDPAAKVIIEAAGIRT
jgi:hypothetical protein